MKLLLISIILTCIIAPGYSAPAKSVNTRDFGVTGDGVTDDTDSLRKAIEAVTPSGGVVNIPAGTLVLTDTIGIPDGVRLIGEGACWENSATTILIKHKNGPGFRLASNCGIKGVAIICPDNMDMIKPVAYPPAIELWGCNVNIENIVFDGVWIGISTAPGGANAGQCLFRDITGFVHHIGIHLSGAMDINRFEDIHWFVSKTDPSAQGDAYYKKNRVGFEFGRQDGMMMNNCFMILGKTFFHQLPYRDTPDGKWEWGLSLGYAISNCWIEAVDEGFVFEGHSGFSISGTNILVNKGGTGVKINADCLAYNATISGVQVRGHNGTFTGIDYALKHDVWAPDKRNKLAITDCHITGAEPAIRLRKNAVRTSIKGSLLAGVDGKPAVVIDEGADLFTITDNILQGPKPISDKSGVTAQKIVKDNIFEK